MIAAAGRIHFLFLKNSAKPIHDSYRAMSFKDILLSFINISFITI